MTPGHSHRPCPHLNEEVYRIYTGCVHQRLGFLGPPGTLPSEAVSAVFSETHIGNDVTTKFCIMQMKQDSERQVLHGFFVEEDHTFKTVLCGLGHKTRGS